ncbi:hypothetical protein A374_06916 [Fictibacillus macauensis ZFHKF-1]|uniref:Rhamnogalacturonase A/B/Epimerase-like pectate lyase domain-containing protein n=1 Tax=Fictibacillus macauensis ZFHKF-1 TaxID=1196324 RepID=I8J2R2_9BACL|nr:glycoside hydrolase family 55 protein [Fictibacillus macauensis]EIT86031.1 hypothetical protein A374_06916 [Fictibacillus macauensis ZFHKF-1]
MLHLEKNHTPTKNSALLDELFTAEINMARAQKETEALFETTSLPDLHSMKSLFAATDVPPRDVVHYNGTHILPSWKQTLDQEYDNLCCKTKQVNVRDYGAVGDGKTDDTLAFQRAIGRGNVSVYVPQGVYITKGVRLPSWTRLYGDGKGKTILKLHDFAPKSAWVIANRSFFRGNDHLAVEHMSLDWNVERLSATEKTAAGNNRSSALTYAHVTYGWVTGVEAINPGLHCFDVSSHRYTYWGDGTRARRRSRYVWLDQLTGYGFGDDGATTHHSEYVLISNCHFSDPSGRAHDTGFSNSNGFEIDDGSSNVMLLNNSSARCFGGVEIKAHHHCAAASHTIINGHISVHDNRSFNFRHIGHHIESDPESLSAYNITASRLVAIAPIRTPLYKDSTQRALVVSAYRNVVINHMIAIGDAHYDYKEQPVLALQYRSRHIKLHNITIRQFTSASADIQLFGGSHGTDDVELCNVTITDSAPIAIQVGPNITKLALHHVTATRKQGNKALLLDGSKANIHHFKADGYRLPVSTGKTH